MARKPVSRGDCAQGSYRQGLWRAVNVLLDAAFWSRVGTGSLSEGRRWTARMLVWASLQMSWAGDASLDERFETMRRSLTEQFPGRRRVGKSYRGYSKAVARQSPRLLPMIQERLREVSSSFDAACQRLYGFAVFVVDASKIELARAVALEQTFGCAGKAASAPQALLTVLLSLLPGVPIDYRVGPADANERAHLSSMWRRMPAGALLLGDAFYTTYDLLRAMHEGGRFFLVRVGANVRLLRKLGYAQQEGRDTVYLWPNQKAKDLQPPLVLRLIRVKGRDKAMYLLTNVTDHHRLRHKQARALYQMRWGVELFYRTFKRTLAKTKLLSRSPQAAAYELRWAVIALWMLRLMTAQAQRSAGADPSRMSTAQALRHVRAMLAQPARRFRRGDSLTRRLANARYDDYQRKSPKQAREWPRKKQHQSPGTPKIINATETQTRQAQQLRELFDAA